MTANRPEDVFLKIDVREINECWLWQGRLDKKGYGGWDLNGRSVKAHRIAYEVYKGPVPPDKEICHACRNRRCCNPAHLFAGTHAENMRTKRCSLTQAQIELIKNSPLQQRELARVLGVHQSTVSRVRRFMRVASDG